jgi:cullin 1
MVIGLTHLVENQTDFKTYLNAKSNIHPGIELQVIVLDAQFWPTYVSFELDVPCEMDDWIEVVKGFYSTKHKVHKLKWIYLLGNCNIIGRFDLKQIEITASIDQASMLCCSITQKG